MLSRWLNKIVYYKDILLPQVYALSKLLSEEAAFKFAKENDMDLVSVITTTVAGPFFTTTVPSSVKVIMSPIIGDLPIFYIAF